MPRQRVKKSQKEESPSLQAQTSSAHFLSRFNRSRTLFVLAVLGIIALLFYFRGFLIVATVNGQPITRISVLRELEKQGGKQVLNSLVTKTLILQQAQKKNIKVDQKEIDEGIKKVEKDTEKSGGKLDEILALQGMSKEDLRDQIRIQKLVEKMLEKDMQVTEKDIDKFTEENKSSFPEGTDSSKLRDEIRVQLQQRKLSEAFQKWVEKAQKEAKITYFVKY